MKDEGRRPLYRYWTPNYWPIWLGLGFLRLIGLFPQATRLSIGFALGRFGHRLARTRRAVTRQNIALCFPELTATERDALALRHFEALGASAVELALGRWASDEELSALMRVEGVDQLRAFTEKGIGVILLSAHFTSLEISGRVLKTLIPPFDGVYRKNRNPFMTEILRSSRERSVRRAIEKNDIKSMVRSLREGTPVWYAPDQSYRGKQSALLPFFGVPAMSNTATSTLARLGKAVVMPFFPQRMEDGHYVLTILPPIENFPCGDAALDTERYYAILEKQIRRCPEQYYWIHKKFKDRPAPLPDVYSALDTLK